MLRLFAFLFVALTAGTVAAQQTYWAAMADQIGIELATAERLAQSGQPEAAKKAVGQAYFGLFETEKMEAALRKEIGSKHAFEREKQFGDLRKLLSTGTLNEVKAMAAALRAGLAEDAKLLDKAGVSPEVFKVNQ